ncbi:MAG: hypothetical protein PHW53_03730 [Patescibacteria group bacterium]|nr:hypothetical protein [Patescibacteria group bacterium]
MNKLETKIDEILDALHIFADSVDDRFNKVDQRFNGVDQRFMSIEQRFNKIDERFEQVDKRFNRIEALMVTKDYLDDKLADFRAEWIPIIKKVDTKDSALVVNLADKDVISRDEEKEILDMSAFPRLN